jgi:predicted GNAT superfamily acetyltransferase
MAGVPHIRDARDASDFEACVRLQREVWDLADLDITSSIQLVATVHAGGQLLVAEDDSGQVVGFSYAFAALRGGEPHLHSDMLAVRVDRRGEGLGARLKWAQREAALERGVGLITWTFDPMQARNAGLNLHRLGATASEIYPDFYGVTTSALHHGLPTDRLLVRWDLNSSRVVERRRASPPPAGAPSGPRVHDVTVTGGRPVASPPRLDLGEPVVLLEIPSDWDSLCRRAPAQAARWQRQVTEALSTYLGRGYRAVDFLTSDTGGGAGALYVLSREP